MRRNALLLLGVILCATFMAGPASAQVQPAGTGEPLYTNSNQNTQWLEWPAGEPFTGWYTRRGGLTVLRRFRPPSTRGRGSMITRSG